jgi:ribonuclease E
MSQEEQTTSPAVTSEGSEGDTAKATPKPRPRRRGGSRGRGGGAKGAAPAGSKTGSVTEGETAGGAGVTEGPRAPAERGSSSKSEGSRTTGSTSTDEGSAPEASPSEAGAPSPARRRRRRGGRGRGKKKPAASTAEGASTDSAEPDVSEASADGAAKPKATAAKPKATAAKPKATAAKPKATAAKPKATAAKPETEAEIATAEEEQPRASEETTTAPARKRRRRGGRGRGRKKPSNEAEAAERAEAGATAGAAPARAAAPSTRRRTPKEPGEPKEAPKEPKEQAPVSTRLRRSRQTRQSGRRRREPILVVPRVTDKLMVITEHGERDQIAVLEGADLAQHYVTRIGARSMVGNVYLGRVQNVLPGMEAAFIDVGRGRNAVLYAGEVNYSPEDLEGTPPRIEKVLKSGQSVLVQVSKDPIGGKGARLTAQISMPGRYLVLVPNSTVTGISRRLPDGERRRLKAIYKSIKPEQHGLIVRTAAEGASEEALASDLARLLEEWATIEKKSKKAKAPAVLYEEPELTVRVVRDLFTDEEYRELVTDSPRVYQVITEYLQWADPELLAKVRLHEGKLPVFEEFHVVEQIHKGLDRKVWLPSGGYLVIDRTEALTVIDVNTGKSVGKTNLEETVVNTNLEAAREVARQLRLRDIGGMIVIDFIDMLLEQNKKKVIDAMKEALAQDKSRSQVFDISPLGLLEVTRKRVSGGLLESFSETCPTCEGRGVLLTYDVN